MSEPKRTVVLFEHTWKCEYGELAGTIVKTFRIVGAYWDDEAGQVGALYCEELYSDAMGVASWHRVEEDDRYMVPFGRLLQLAGLLPKEDSLESLP